ncbi:MAG: 50S ribosomal protein L13 [Acidobacteriota bacterium]
MRTTTANLAELDRQWIEIDADGKVLGRLATEAARLLMGKHRPIYTPFLDTGDFVIVVNASRVKLTGRKEEDKIYRRHSGFEGGLIERRASIVRQRTPLRMVEEAVRGMLPKTKLGDAMYRKLKVYAGATHPHTAQKPTKREVA